MSIAVSNVTVPSAVTNASSQTFAHNNDGSGLIVAGTTWRNTDVTPTCTYAGTSLALETTGVSSQKDRASIFSSPTPATGSNNVVVTVGSSADINVCAISLTGTDTSDLCGTPPTPTTGTSTTPSISVPSAEGKMVLSVLAWWHSPYDSSASNAGAGQTVHKWSCPNYISHTAVSSKAGETSTSMSHTIQSTGGWAMVGVSINAAPGLAATIGGTAQVAAALATEIAFGGTATGFGAAAAALSTAIELAAAVAGSANVSATITTPIELGGNAAGEGGASGDLATGITVSAEAVASAASAGNLTTAIDMIGQAPGTATVAAALSTVIELQGAVAVTVLASGGLDTAAAEFAGSAQASAAAGADLATQVALAGSTSGAADAQGQFGEGTQGLPHGARTRARIISYHSVVLAATGHRARTLPHNQTAKVMHG